MKTNDLATAWNLALQLEETIQGERVANPFITAERQKVLDALSEKLGKNPLLPQIDPFTGQRIGGAIDLSNQNADGTVPYGALLPGWHFVLGGADERGVAKWGLEQDTGVPGSWEADHVVVHTTYGGKVVTGDVKKKDAPVSPTVFASVPGGRFTFEQTAQYITYTDEHGQRVDAYSLDGQTWIRSLTGAAPALQINTVLTELDDNKGGKIYTDSLGKTVLTTTGVPDASGKVVYVPDATYLANNPGSVDWYGMGDLKKHEQDVAKFEAADLTPSRRTAEWLKGNTVGVGNSVGLSVGAPGQKMQVIEMSDTGQLNLTGKYTPNITADSNWRSGGWRAGENDSAVEAPRAPYPGPVTPGTIALGDAVMRLTLRMRAGPDAEAAGAAAIKAQLPANTPPRYDGVGFNETRFILPKITPVTLVPVTGGRLKIVTAPPPLKSLAPQRGLATATRATLPPAPKRTTPPKQPPKAPPKRPTPKPKPKPKPPPKPSTSLIGNFGAR